MHELERQSRKANCRTRAEVGASRPGELQISGDTGVYHQRRWSHAATIRRLQGRSLTFIFDRNSFEIFLFDVLYVPICCVGTGTLQYKTLW